HSSCFCKQPNNNEHTLAKPIDQGTCNWSDHEQGGRPRKQAQTGSKWSIALRSLQELRHKEQGSTHRSKKREVCHMARGEGARAEKTHRHHWRVDTQFPDHEG